MGLPARAARRGPRRVQRPRRTARRLSRCSSRCRSASSSTATGSRASAPSTPTRSARASGARSWSSCRCARSRSASGRRRGAPRGRDARRRDRHAAPRPPRDERRAGERPLLPRRRVPGAVRLRGRARDALRLPAAGDAALDRRAGAGRGRRGRRHGRRSATGAAEAESVAAVLLAAGAALPRAARRARRDRAAADGRARSAHRASPARPGTRALTCYVLADLVAPRLAQAAPAARASARSPIASASGRRRAAACCSRCRARRSGRDSTGCSSSTRCMRRSPASRCRRCSRRAIAPRPSSTARSRRASACPASRWCSSARRSIFGERRQQRRTRKVSAADVLSSLAELKADDYVVHVDHGIGLYRGLKHLTVAGTEGDYLHLEYLGGDRLYLPVDRINLVQKYVGGGDAAQPGARQARRHRRGSASRRRPRRRCSRWRASWSTSAPSARCCAGQRFESGDPLYQEFEARFPFDETPDQQRAIDEVLADLGGERPMDRLVCGDVGFGKTEVAMRAAFVVVMAGRQVAVLVPTTVLAQQHFDTFRARFAGYPMRIEMLSRFRSKAENAATVRGPRRRHRRRRGRHPSPAAEGRRVRSASACSSSTRSIASACATRRRSRRCGARRRADAHRHADPADAADGALGHPRPLGHREPAASTASPIRTYVTSADDHVVRDAILREIRRGGQVFFVHNRVDSIDRQAAHLARARARGDDRRRPRADGRAPARAGDGRLHARSAPTCWCARRSSSRGSTSRAPTRSSSTAPIPSAWRSSTSCADASAAPTCAPTRTCSIPGEHMIGKDAHKRLAGAAGARRARRRLPARGARPRDPRRRQHARQAAVGAHHRGRLRALHPDDGGRGARGARRDPRRPRSSPRSSSASRRTSPRPTSRT